MRAFEIYVNGERVCLAGVTDRSVLTTIIDYSGRDREPLHLHVGGLLIPQEEHVRWQDRDLDVGDEIRVRIVETDEVDPPAKRFRKDPKKDLQSKKHYVQTMAKKFGWKIQIVRRRP